MKIKWHTNSEDTKLQQRGAENILKHTPGPCGPVKSVQAPLELFNLFFSKEMIDNIVKYTNQKQNQPWRCLLMCLMSLINIHTFV